MPLPEPELIAAGGLAISVIAAVLVLVARYRQARHLRNFRDDVIAVSADASVGRRLDASGSGPVTDLAITINRLFDAIGERDVAIAQRNALFSDFAGTLPEIAIVHDERILMANERAAALIGLHPDQLHGKAVVDLVKPAYRALFRKTVTKLLAREEIPRRLEIQLINGSEQGLWVEVQMALIDYLGKPSVLTIARDISYRKNLEASLGRTRWQAQHTLESIAEGVITTDNQGKIDYMNRAAESLTGASRDEAVGRATAEIFSLIDEADRRHLGDPDERCLAMRRRVNMGRRALLIGAEGGREYSVEITASPIRGPEGGISGAVIVIHDVSEIRGLTRQMSYQATHDPLTGLVNRREFERRLQEAIDTAHANEISHMLFYMDLDRFKAVNDSCGHIAGDNLLREVANLIKQQVRESDFVGRLGGDEFGALLTRCPIEKARQIAADICNAIADYRFVWQDKIFNIGISVGLVEITRSSGNLQDVISAADSACYVAKQRGRGQVHVYSARDEAIARERGDIQWLRQMQSALQENRFELATQPIIATAGASESGPAIEVLLRLPDDAGRTSSTAEFLRPAERYQLMPQIDRWVVAATLTAIGAGKIRLPGRRTCMINLSSQTLGDEGFLTFVVDTLDRSGVSPNSICFEVSESAVSEDVQRVRRFIEVVHGIGCEFALDDFGRGLGSFSSLKNLPVDYLKIDGSYTRNLAADEINQEMVSAMIKLARTMEFRIVAEQVERQQDFDWLCDVGVDFVQGHYIESPAILGASLPGNFRKPPN